MAGHYDVLVTMDRSIEFQQRISTLPFGIVLIRASSHRMHDLRPIVPSILSALDAAKPGRIGGPAPDQTAPKRFFSPNASFLRHPDRKCVTSKRS